MPGGRDEMDERNSIAKVWAHQQKTLASEEASYNSQNRFFPASIAETPPSRIVSNGVTAMYTSA
jgi:hypothetical protein